MQSFSGENFPVKPAFSTTRAAYVYQYSLLRERLMPDSLSRFAGGVAGKKDAGKSGILSASSFCDMIFYPSIGIYLLSSITGFASFFGMDTFRIPSSNLALISSCVISSPT